MLNAKNKTAIAKNPEILESDKDRVFNHHLLEVFLNFSPLRIDHLKLSQKHLSSWKGKYEGKTKTFYSISAFSSLMGGCLREQCTKSITLIGEIATNREMDIEYPFLYGLQSIQYGLSIMNWISIFSRVFFWCRIAFLLKWTSQREKISSNS